MYVQYLCDTPFQTWGKGQHTSRAGTSQKEAFGLDHVEELERGGGEGVENRIVFGGVS